VKFFYRWVKRKKLAFLYHSFRIKEPTGFAVNVLELVEIFL
jgi:hypothetical protein